MRTDPRPDEEVPDADAAEQSRPVVPAEEPPSPGDLPLEADPADAADQRAAADPEG